MQRQIKLAKLEPKREYCLSVKTFNPLACQFLYNDLGFRNLSGVI